MGLDIRLPIGMMFTLIGLLLSISGYMTKADTAMYQCSLGININLVWVVILFAFGFVMLLLALLAKSVKEDAPKSAETAEVAR